MLGGMVVKASALIPIGAVEGIKYSKRLGHVGSITILLTHAIQRAINRSAHPASDICVESGVRETIVRHGTHASTSHVEMRWWLGTST